MSERSRVFGTQAVVLRRSNYGEADRLLTLFTPSYGKLRVIAKGVRRPTARASGHVELYTVIETMLARGQNLHVLTQAELKEPFLTLTTSLERIGYASHFAELIDRFAVDEQENRAAYELLVAGLGWLCESNVDLQLAARFYELKLLDVMGYGPSLFRCAISGELLDPADHFYSPADGGVVAAAYAHHHEELIPLPLDVFKVLRHFSRSQWAQVRTLRLTARHQRVLTQVLHTTLAFLLEQRLQSVGFLRRIMFIHTDAE